MSLQKQITIALVLFGLVPSLVIASFALDAAEDFKLKQLMLIRDRRDHNQRSSRGASGAYAENPGSQGGETHLGPSHRQAET